MNRNRIAAFVLAGSVLVSSTTGRVPGKRSRGIVTTKAKAKFKQAFSSHRSPSIYKARTVH